MNNRHKHRYKICKDSKGVWISAGDTVELFNGLETKSAWTSKVYWNMVDGAFVDSHRAHVKMGLSYHRSIKGFIGIEDWEQRGFDGEAESIKTYCKKIKNFKR